MISVRPLRLWVGRSISSSTLWCEIENPSSGACGLGSSEDGAIIIIGMPRESV